MHAPTERTLIIIKNASIRRENALFPNQTAAVLKRDREKNQAARNEDAVGAKTDRRKIGGWPS